MVALTVIVYYLREKYQYFKRRGVPTPKIFPVLGNLKEFFFRIKTMPDMYKDMYNQYPKNRFFGIYEFVNPAYVIRDPELIKQIFVKDFENFANHRNKIDAEIDPLIGNSLFGKKQGRFLNHRKHVRCF